MKNRKKRRNANPDGRPSKLTDEVERIVCETIRASTRCWYQSTASSSSMREWIARDISRVSGRSWSSGSW